MHGNVWEWVSDCWHDNYSGAPVDGSSWTADGDCGYRILRGGSWLNPPKTLRAANRLGLGAEDRLGNDGFRVALTLPR